MIDTTNVLDNTKIIWDVPWEEEPSIKIQEVADYIFVFNTGQVHDVAHNVETAHSLLHCLVEELNVPTNDIHVWSRDKENEEAARHELILLADCFEGGHVWGEPYDA